MENLQAEVQQLRQVMESGFSELRESQEGLRKEFHELKEEMREFKAEIRQEMREFKEEIRQEIREAQVETRRHFDVALEGIRDQVQLIVEMYRSDRDQRLALETRVGRLEEGQVHLGNRITVLERKRR